MTIRHLRKQRGFTSDRALAIAAGVPQPSLAKYLSGGSGTMKVASFQAIARVLNVTLSELLGEVPIAACGGNAGELAAIFGRLAAPEQRALLAAARAMADMASP